MKYLLTALGLLFFECAVGQVADDFSDGNFNSDPVWTGTSDFDASDGTLKLDADGAGNSYLTTPQTQFGGTTWEFLVHFDFNPSSTSLAKIFLSSNSADLSEDLEGYFVMIGDTEDEISLYKKDGSVETYIINGTDDVIDAGTIHARIKVTRDDTGHWELFHDIEGGTSYSQEGEKTFDNSFNTTSFFGIYCQYTATRTSAIYFDDFRISSEPESFGVSEILIEDDQNLRIIFNQNVDLTSSENINFYEANYDFGHPQSAIRDHSNRNEVLISFENAFVNNTYTLSINSVQNGDLNETIESTELVFKVEAQTAYRSIVINEIMVDPTPVVGLPEAEYVELYNTSDQAINIQNFEIDSRVIEDNFVLGAKNYVILTSRANAHLFSGNVIGLSTLSLSNNGETLELIDNLGHKVDTVTYTSDWYQNSEKKEGGYSLEQINPEKKCSNANNWIASENSNGGTPGTENSEFDLTPDTISPNLIDFFTIDHRTFQLTFDETMVESSLSLGTYQFDPELELINVTPLSPGFNAVQLDISSDLINDLEYVVTVEDVTDCSGNVINKNSLTYVFDNQPPQLDRIEVRSSTAINLHFNESLDGDSSENLENYSSSHTDADPISAQLDLNHENIVNLKWDAPFEWNITNTLNILQVTDQKGNEAASPISSSFTLKQEVDSVYVLGINLLDVKFSSELDPSTVNEIENYSVNDNVGFPVNAFVDLDNNQLVHLTFANNFNDNKELKLSISNLKNKKGEFLTTPDLSFVYDTSAPKIDTVIVLSSNELKVVFTEKVDSQSVISRENYEYQDTYVSDVNLLDDLQSVILFFDEEFQREVIYELLVDGVQDLYGNEIKSRIKYYFVYDIFGPQLDSAIVRSARELKLIFNENLHELSAENHLNYFFHNTEENPISAILDKENPNIVSLNFETEIPEGNNLKLEVFNLQDQRGNTNSSSILTTFSYDHFFISSINALSHENIKIEFNKVPNESKSNRANYKINGETIEQITFDDNRIATIDLSTDLTDKSSNTLSITSIRDANIKPLSIENYDFDFDSHLSSSSLIGDRTIELIFDHSLDVLQILDLTNFSSNPSLGNCVAAVIDPDDPEKIRLTFEKPLLPDVSYSIAWAKVANEYGRILPAFFTHVIKDETPPDVLDFSVLDQNSIWIRFSEPLIESSAEFEANYSILGIGQPISIKYYEADTSVILDFDSNFEKSKNYILHVENLRDLSGNILEEIEINIQYNLPEPPSFGELIITEILADPTPEVGLSDKEYIEIYNRTDRVISLKGIHLTDQSGSTTFVSGELESNAYVVICSSSSVNAFDEGLVIGISNFPSLNNSRETISLMSDKGLIFSTSYSNDWYKNSEKSEGGWSLEMIDVNNPCGEKSNWTACINPLGGTPGKTNSVQTSNPDNFGPELVNAFVVDSLTIELNFNEKIHPHTINHASYNIEPQISPEFVEANFPEFNSIILNLTQALEPKINYSISVSGIADCLGNIIASDKNSRIFSLPEEATIGDLVINEVLFNPKAGGVDFVEVYNNSDKNVDLKNWKLGDQNDQLKIITSEHYIIGPDTYLALTPDSEVLQTQYPQSTQSQMISSESFPSLNNDEDSVLFINPKGIVIDQMYYHEDYHYSLLESAKGVSLERISVEAKSMESESWKSAASTAGFATPGLENSQTQRIPNTTATLTISPKVFIPNNDGFNDYTNITYDLEYSGLFANVLVYSLKGEVVKSLAEGALLSNSGFFTWDGFTDQGALANTGYYIVVFEMYDSEGNQSVLKETVVLGTQF